MDEKADLMDGFEPFAEARRELGAEHGGAGA